MEKSTDSTGQEEGQKIPAGFFTKILTTPAYMVRLLIGSHKKVMLAVAANTLLFTIIILLFSLLILSYHILLSSDSFKIFSQKSIISVGMIDSDVIAILGKPKVKIDKEDYLRFVGTYKTQGYKLPVSHKVYVYRIDSLFLGDYVLIYINKNNRVENIFIESGDEHSSYSSLY